MCCHGLCCCCKEEEEVRREPPPVTQHQLDYLRKGHDELGRQKEWNALHPRPTVNTPPSKPPAVGCEPKPAKAHKPKPAKAKSVQLTLSDTQTDKAVLKDGAVHGAGEGEVRTALPQTSNSMASAAGSAYFSAAGSPMPQTKL